MTDNGKIIKQASEMLGFSYDEKRWISVGRQSGFTVLINSTPANSNVRSIFVTLCCSHSGVAPDTSMFDGIVSRTVKCSVNSFKVCFTITVKGKANAVSDSIADTVKGAAQALCSAGFENCDESGLLGATDIYLLKEKYVFLNDISAEQAESQLSMEIESYEQLNENVGLGTVGALIGSVVGVLLILLLGRLGRVSLLSGLVMGICSIFGYKKLGTKIGKKGSVICIVISLVMTYLGFRLDTAIDIYSVFKEELEGIAFSECLLYSKEVFELADSLDTYYMNLFMMMLTGVGGAVAAVYAENKQLKSNREFIKLT